MWPLVEGAALIVLAAAGSLFLYTYLGYPVILGVLGRRARALPDPSTTGDAWPTVSITVPAYNEEAQIEGLIESLLAIDYPRDRLQVLVVSDASSDRTDEMVRAYADRGVQLLRLSERGGKTKAENAAAEHLTGEVIVNTDASIRIAPDALKPLVAVFSDAGIGCASGRDVSVGPDGDTGNEGESSYVGYEMAIRELETRVSGIVGASGCFYAIRPQLHRLPLPDSLSRDFAAALLAREHGLRAVSVSEARCYVPRARSLRKEFRRKVRTITRGMETLWHKRALMSPRRTGVFAWMLWSHKVARWMLPWAALFSLAALGVLAPRSLLAAAALGAGTLVLILALVGWALSDRQPVPRVFALPAFAVAGNLAAMIALLRALHGDQDALWEPTRRESVRAAR